MLYINDIVIVNSFTIFVVLFLGFKHKLVLFFHNFCNQFFELQILSTLSNMIFFVLHR